MNPVTGLSLGRIAIGAAAVAGLMAARDGSVTRPTGAFLTAPALGAVAAGVAGWRA